MDMNIAPGKLWGLRRLADVDGYWRMIATDQRELFAHVVSAASGKEPAPYREVAEIVSRLATELQSEASAVLLDPIYGYLNTTRRLQADKGLLLSYESLDMERSGHGVRTGPIPGWSVQKIRRLGADGVKLLVPYRADDEAGDRKHQEDFVERTGQECLEEDIPLLLEVLIHQHEGESDEDFLAQRGELTVAAIDAFKDSRFRVDIYKLPPPGSLLGVPEAGTPEGDTLQDVYLQMVRDLPAPWVLLSAGMNKVDFRRSLEFAFGASASGYLAGRAVWSQAPAHYPSFDAINESLRAESIPYLQQLNELTAKNATPWYQHPAVNPVGISYELDRAFAQHYPA
jgi:tagatose 1,6-diphosphate aldolase